MDLKMTMNHTFSRRAAATAPSGRLETLLRAVLAGALLALAPACSGERDAASDGIEGELEDQASEGVDVSEPEGVRELSEVIEKATFNDNLTFNNVNIACTSAQKTIIRAAETRAREILGIAGPANADARVNRNTLKAGRFRTNFVPNGNRNPDPNRTSPDAWDTASFRAGQKMVKVAQVLGSAVHGCPAGNEPIVRRADGTFRTCDEALSNAATEFVGGADNPIRWCPAGLAQSPDDIAITLLHELTHQDRTVDATGIPADCRPGACGGRVTDDNSSLGLYNAQNWSSWYRNNTQ